MFKENYQNTVMFAILLMMLFAIGIFQQVLALELNCINTNFACQVDLSQSHT